MFPVLNIGSLAVRTPELILLIGLWIGLNLSERQAAWEVTRRPPNGSPYHPPAPDQIYALVMIVLLAAVIGARLAYVLEYPDIFAASPLSSLSLDTGMLDPWGALGASLLAALIYGNRKKLDFWSSLDALSPFFAVLGIALGLSHLASGDAFGASTQVPWCIDLWGACRHPTQIYEIIAASGIFLAIWLTRKQSWSPGLRFLLFLGLSAAARLFLEAFRGDSALLIGGLREAQVVAWGVLGAALWLIRRRIGIKPQEP